jgi:NAD(P)H-dependent FMN reductase
LAAKARDLGAEVTLVDLADYSIPLYDGDLESTGGLPENALRLRQLMLEHDALLISCPEYNGSITPLLKNTIDWTSRPSAERGAERGAVLNEVPAISICGNGFGCA